MATAESPTLGESLAHAPPRSSLAYGYHLGFPSFFSSVPWRLPLLLSMGAYFSVLYATTSYAQLFLPRTPVRVYDNIFDAGTWGGFFIICIMVCVVLGLRVDDARVLVACTCVVAAFVVGVVVVWVWLARTYGGDEDEDEASSESTSARLPV
uniref:DUF7378 domain-containing protein n=3 Tax=Oryza TaxID=4527 RepID=A0A0E0RG10_ORYRU